jgi:hypothetical protein
VQAIKKLAEMRENTVAMQMKGGEVEKRAVVRANTATKGFVDEMRETV